MDYLRFGYEAMMRTYRNRDPVPVVWFRAPTGAVAYKDLNVFRSKNWVSPIVWDGIGEQSTGRSCCGKRDIEWEDSYMPAGYTGLSYAGTPRVAAIGGVYPADPPIALRPDGSPFVCKMADIDMDGGSAEGGDWPMTGYLRPITGGEAEGGDWGMGQPYVVTWGGGDAEAGNWPRLNQLVFSAAGGQGEGGAAPQSGGQIQAAAGGQGEGGAAPQSGGQIQAAAGGQGEGGAALFVQISQTATGGQGEGGTAFQGLPAFQASAGGQGEGGAAFQGLPMFQASAGGQGEGGAAVQGMAFGQAAAGGQGEGGAAFQGFPVFQASAGGQGEGGTAVQRLAIGQVATGGQGEGGTAFQGFPVFQAAAGGQGEGGAAFQGTPVFQVAAGGQGEGGTAVQRVAVSQVATGGQGEGGAAVQGLPVFQASAGGQGEGGTAFQGVAVIQRAAGGQGEGGAAFQGKAAAVQVATGGQGEGGAATFPNNLVHFTGAFETATSDVTITFPPGASPGDLVWFHILVQGPAVPPQPIIRGSPLAPWTNTVVSPFAVQWLYRGLFGPADSYTFRAPPGCVISCTYVVMFNPTPPPISQGGFVGYGPAVQNFANYPTSGPTVGLWFFVATTPATPPIAPPYTNQVLQVGTAGTSAVQYVQLDNNAPVTPTSTPIPPAFFSSQSVSIAYA
jgi:hypothetical protein